MALVERVMRSMQSPVLAFDPEGRLRLLNAAGERAFGLRVQTALGHSATQLKLEELLHVGDDDVISLGRGQQPVRWVVKRTSFRLRGIPHTLLVLSDVSAALREEERLAWERLIRVLGHEINNSLTPIKSIAGSLRGRLAALNEVSGERGDFERGLEVIENRSESLNRFLQAYRQLMGLPAPKLGAVSLAALVERVAQLERRVVVTVTPAADVVLQVDSGSYRTGTDQSGAQCGGRGAESRCDRWERSARGYLVGDSWRGGRYRDPRQWPRIDQCRQPVCAVLHDQAGWNWNRPCPCAADCSGTSRIGPVGESNGRPYWVQG